jgi:hypothetical protein
LEANLSCFLNTIFIKEKGVPKNIIFNNANKNDYVITTGDLNARIGNTQVSNGVGSE